MKTVIYLDELLLVNFLIAAFLLPGTGLLCGASCRTPRIVCGAVLAAASSLLLLAPRLPFALQLAVKALCAAACVRAAFPYRGMRPFLQACAWYLALNLTLAGLVTARLMAQSTPLLQTNNLMLYLNVSPLLLLGCVAAVYSILRLVLWCFERPRPGAAATLGFQVLESRVSVQAFCDTGLAIGGELAGLPGVMVACGAVQDQLPQALAQYLAEFFASAPPGGLPLPQPDWKLRLLACETAAGQGIFPAVPAYDVWLRQNGQRQACGKAMVIFCKGGFPYGCGAAYGPDLAAAAAAQECKGGTTV